jgi:hypothetical protein
MFENKKSFSILNRQCATMSAVPVMGHGVMFTLFGVYSFGAFFQNYNNFEGGG